MDIFCPKCCEPCDIDTIHEFVADMREQFPEDGYNFGDTYRRFVSEGCGAAFPGWGWSCEPDTSGRGAVLRELASVLGDDVDGFASMCEDLESFGGCESAVACENCGGGDEIAGGLCSECFRSLPVGEWRAAGSWGLS